MRFFTILLVAAAVSACGFQPLHQRTTSQQDSALGGIWIENITDRDGQQLRNALLTQLTPLGTPRSPTHYLRVDLSETKASLGITKDDFATRANLTLTAEFILTPASIRNQVQPEDVEPEDVGVFTGTSEFSSSYNVLDSITGTIYSEEDARERAIEQVAQDIRRRIAIFIITQQPG